MQNLVNKPSSHTSNLKKDATRKRRKGEPKPPSMVAYWVLSWLRILLTLLPQTGYIHPDEYFQSVEVVAGDVFDLEVQRPWEFNVTFPIRSVLLPKVIFGVPYILLDTFLPELNNALGWDIRSPYVMLIMPRIVACALSFVTDYSLYKICVLYGQKYRSRLLILASSYVVLIYGTRTLSNSIEMALMSLLLYYVAECMILSEKVLHQQSFIDKKYNAPANPVEKVKLHKMRSSLPPHTFHRCFSIATLVVTGIFNRPTFFAFGLSPVFFWLQRGLQSKNSGLRDFHLRMVVFVVCALPSICLFVLVDSLYYGHLSWNEIGMGSLGLENFVVTPFNFLYYNSQQNNLAEHGLHPRVTHFLVNIPLLYNVLGFTALIAVVNFLSRASQAHWRDLPRVYSIKMLMTASFLIPVSILSVVPHQEPRFLIPITLPLVFMHAQKIQDVDFLPALTYYKQESIQGSSSRTSKPKLKPKDTGGNTLTIIWILINVCCVIFFGFIHQGGVYSLTSHLKESLHKQTKLQVVHLVTSHIYPIPHSLLVQRDSQRKYYNPQSKTRYNVKRKFYSYELGSKSMLDVVDTLNNVVNVAETKKNSENLDYILYLALPLSVIEEFYNSISSNLTYTTEKVFYPHFTSEALPRLRNSKYRQSSEACPEGIVETFTNEDFSFFEVSENEKSCSSQQNSRSQRIVSVTSQIVSVFKQFGLTLLHIKKKT